MIVGDDWWMERHEYDGSEWWEFKELPKKPTFIDVPNRVLVTEDMVGWCSLEKINDRLEDID